MHPTRRTNYPQAHYEWEKDTHQHLFKSKWFDALPIAGGLLKHEHRT